MPVNIGGGQGAIAIEQQALALIVALGGKKEIEDNIKAFSKARQKVEVILGQLDKAKADLVAGRLSQERRERDVVAREETCRVTEEEYVRRSEEFNKTVERHKQSHAENLKNLANMETELKAKTYEFNKDVSTKVSELLAREGAISKNEKEVGEKLITVGVTLREAETLKAKWERKLVALRRLVEEG